ncbi:hypothetical protein [Sphingopyxis sp.]|uniref:hypothetical protein n=1 Tax=Sphingopyxis sp. TaxID=1908224 RepID=UPI002FC79290
MSESKKRYAATRDTDSYYSYAIGTKSHIDNVLRRWSPDAEGAEPPENKETAPEEDFSHHSALSETLNSSVEFALSQYHIILLLDVLEAVISKGMVQNTIFKVLEEKANLIEETDHYKLYELEENLSETISINDERAKLIKKGTKKIAPSIFIGMIATFDALIVDIIGKLIKLNPERYSSQDKTISLDKIIGASSVDDIVQEFIAEELYRFSRESHESQTSYIEKNFSISIKEKWKRWPDFIEIFERRNLVAHGELRFNQRYAQICDRNGHKGSFDLVGQEVKIEAGYLIQSLYVLCEYAILLSFALWRKLVTEKEVEAFETLNEAAYKIITNNHHTLAQRILEFALSLKGTKVNEDTRKRMVVNLASASKSSQSPEFCNKILDDEDWSACSYEYKLSVAALKEDLDAVTPLISTAKQSGFNISNFRQWPVFRFIRDNERFNDEIEKHYDCRVASSTKAVTEEKEPLSIPQAEAGDDTRH